METKNGNRDHGEIVMYDASRSFGFIQPDAGGVDIFFHINAVDDRVLPHKIVPGARVTFVADIAKNKKGYRAQNVKLEKD